MHIFWYQLFLALLFSQFRPPVDCPTIELPAGLVDEGETAQEA